MLITIVCTAMALLPAAVYSAGVYEVTFQRVEQTMGFDILKSNLRITKLNRTCAVLNGTVDIFMDMDNNFTLQVKAAYSRLGNNQFNEYPMKLAEKPLCDFMSTTYREFQDMFKNTSSLPQVGPEGLCPLTAGHYWYKHVTLDPKYAPPYVPEGYWRLTGLVISQYGSIDLQVFMRVSKDSFF